MIGPEVHVPVDGVLTSAFSRPRLIKIAAHNGDPCCDPTNWNVKAPYATGLTSDPRTFNPVKLNTTQWMDSITALGANIAILTAKHGCGFTIWPTKSTLPDGSPYGYDVSPCFSQRRILERD